MVRSGRTGLSVRMPALCLKRDAPRPVADRSNCVDIDMLARRVGRYFAQSPALGLGSHKQLFVTKAESQGSVTILTLGRPVSSPAASAVAELAEESSPWPPYFGQPARARPER